MSHADSTLVRTQSDAQALLAETVEFYSQAPARRRAVSGDECFYFSATGEPCQCAVGRCLLEPDEIQRRFPAMDIKRIYRAMPSDSFVEIFKPEYRGYPVAFWSQLQQLHDRSDHWSNIGLSQSGLRAVAVTTNWIKNVSGMPT